ncbi:MAG: WhiB family transcriptional regulator [Acidimicrobiia bacterium]|nr:WhiB family transcriptional regulator [Acidimicrobiia bacterium]MYC84342.1 WhiB family transcriptional regulator [Acidimicrobiia bacterium]
MRGSTTPFILTSIQPPVGGSSWRDQAACRTTDPGVFFPDPGDVVGVERARQVCDGCPVATECLSYAVGTNQTEGIWGGTTPGERRRLRQRWLKELREAG